jgi:hypothetical protein
MPQRSLADTRGSGLPDRQISIMLGVGSRQRARPTPLRDVISIYQRLKSGAEFDQFGVKGLRRRRR